MKRKIIVGSVASLGGSPITSQNGSRLDINIAVRHNPDKKGN